MIDEINPNSSIQPAPVIQPDSIQNSIPLPQSAPKKSKSLNILIILVGILFLMGFTGFGVWAYMSKVNVKNNQDNISQTKPEVSTLPETKVEENKIDEMAGRKTYENKEYGFEFKYPDDKLVDFSKNPYLGFCNDNKRNGIVDLRILKEGEKLPIKSEGQIDVSFYIYAEKNIDHLSIENWIDNNCLELNNNKKELYSIAELSALKYTRIGEGMGSPEIQPYILFNKNDLFFLIHPYGNKVLFDQILATFKFIN